MSDTKAPSIAKLNGINYQSWKFKMRMVLVERGLWKIVSGEVLEPADRSKLNDYYNLQDRAFATIALNLEDDQLHHIQNLSDNASDAWNVLADVHEPKGAIYVMHTLQQLLHLHKDSATQMQEHVDTFQNLVSRFRAASDEHISDSLLAMILVSSVGEEYENLIVALGTQSTTLSLEVVKTHLLSEAARRKNC